MANFEHLLASDAERSIVVARLQDAAAEGRLTLSEFSQRASRAFGARTWFELDQLLLDLPSPRAVGSASVRYLHSRRALPTAALGIGIMAVFAGFLLPWGVLLGPIGVLFGVFSLCAEGGQSPTNRRLSVAGIVGSLVAPTFFVSLHLLIGALPS